MSTRLILGLQYMVHGLRQLGEHPDDVLRRFGLDLDAMAPGAQIDRALEMLVHMAIAEQLKDPLAGLVTGTYFGFAGYGPFTMLLATCSTAFEAVQMGVQYQRLSYLFGQLSFQPGQSLSALSIHPVHLPEKAYHYRIDSEISGTCKLLREFQETMHFPPILERVDFPYPEPPASLRPRYQACVAVPVSFGAEQGRLWLNNEVLQRRLPTSDPRAHALYRTLCDEALRQQEQDDAHLPGRIEQFLGMFRRQYPDAAQVAQAFALSERGLRHRLRQHQTSFRALRDQVRMQRAEHLLSQDTMTIERAAEELGYADAPSFVHAFTRLRGMSPARWRRTLL